MQFNNKRSIDSSNSSSSDNKISNFNSLASKKESKSGGGNSKVSSNRYSSEKDCKKVNNSSIFSKAAKEKNQINLNEKDSKKNSIKEDIKPILKKKSNEEKENNQEVDTRKFSNQSYNNKSKNSIKDSENEENSMKEKKNKYKKKNTLNLSKLNVDKGNEDEVNRLKTIIGFGDNRKLCIVSQVYDSLSDDENQFNFEDYKYLIHPDSPFKKSFDFILLLVILVFSITIPLNLTLEFSNNHFFTLVDIISDVVLFFSIIFNFFIPYYNDSIQLIFNKTMIFNKYFYGMNFFVDFLVFFPINTILNIVEVTDLKLHLLRLVRLIKIFKLGNINLEYYKTIFFYNFFQQMLIDSLTKYGIFVQFFQFLIGFFFSMHACSCIYIFLAKLNPENNWILYRNLEDSDFNVVYISSVYFHLVTIFTVGFGDIRSKTSEEIVYNSLFLMIGIGVYSLTVSFLSKFAIDDPKTKNVNKNIEYLKYLNTNYSIPSKIYTKALRIIKNDNEVMRNEKISLIEELPVNLKQELVIQSHREVFDNFKFFKEKSIVNKKEFISKVIQVLKPGLAYKNDILIGENQIVQETIFNKEGVMSLEVNYRGICTSIISIRRNEHFGDSLMMLHKPSPVLARVKSTILSIFLLRKFDFIYILIDYPTIFEKIFLKGTKNLENLSKSIEIKKELIDDIILEKNNNEVKENEERNKNDNFDLDDIEEDKNKSKEIKTKIFAEDDVILEKSSYRLESEKSDSKFEKNNETKKSSIISKKGKGNSNIINCSIVNLKSKENNNSIFSNKKNSQQKNSNILFENYEENIIEENEEDKDMENEKVNNSLIIKTSQEYKMVYNRIPDSAINNPLLPINSFKKTTSNPINSEYREAKNQKSSSNNNMLTTVLKDKLDEKNKLSSSSNSFLHLNTKHSPKISPLIKKTLKKNQSNSKNSIQQVINLNDYDDLKNGSTFHQIVTNMKDARGSKSKVKKSIKFLSDDENHQNQFKEGKGSEIKITKNNQTLNSLVKRKELMSPFKNNSLKNTNYSNPNGTGKIKKKKNRLLSELNQNMEMSTKQILDSEGYFSGFFNTIITKKQMSQSKEVDSRIDPFI